MSIDPTGAAMADQGFQGPNIAALEQQAHNMTAASIAGYGTFPDPQLATEGLLTGAAPALSSMIAEGNPALASVVLSQPIGQSQFTQKGVAPPTSLFNDPYSFDPKQYDQYKQQYDQKGINNGFKSMGEVPMANLGWYNQILTGNPDQLKKWQHFLADHGFYGNYDQSGQNFTKGEANGYNTPDFQRGLKQWALAYFLPQALYSRDVQEITNAQQFLSALGYDPNAIASQMAHNPQQRTQVIDTWLHAQGPDNKHGVDALNQFADHFGSAALPDQLNSLRGDGVFGSIGNFLGHIPGVGNLLGTTPEQLDEKLTPAEKELLAPSLQDAHNGSGFLGFVGDVLSAPSKALVTAGYFFGDAIHGDVENPFDASSKVRKQADTFVASPMTQIFGEQFAKDHPWLKTIGDVVVNLADDPLTFIPFVGGVKAVRAIEEAGGALTKVEKATGGLISHRVGTTRLSYVKPTTVVRSLRNQTLVSTLGKALNPIENAQKDIAHLLTNEHMDHGLIRDVVHDHSIDGQKKIEHLEQLGKAKDERGILTFLRDPKNGYAHNLYDMSVLTNRDQYHKVLKNLDKLSDGKALHVFNTFHMNDSSNLINLKDPAQAVDGFRNAAMVAGLKPDEIKSFVNEFWKASGDDFKRLNLADKMVKQIETTKGEEWVRGYHDWRKSLRSKGWEEDSGNTLLYGADPNPANKGAELSWRSSAPKFTNDIPGGMTKTQMTAQAQTLRDGMSELTAQFQNTIDRVAEEHFPGVPIDEARSKALQMPEMKNQAETYSTMVRGMTDHIDQMVKDSSAAISESPAPFMTTQSAAFAHLPYTASEIMAYDHKFLRTAESIQKRLLIDKAMNLWKGLVLSKPSTLMRIIFGDETSRVHINLLANDPGTWASYMRDMMTRRGHNYDDLIKEHPELVTTVHALAQQGAGDARHVAMVAGDTGYKENLTRLIQRHYSKQQWVKEWMTAVEKARAGGKDWEKAGKDALKKHMKGESEEARTLREFAKIPDIKRGANKQVDNLVATQHYAISRFLNYGDTPERQHMWDWVKSGKVDQKKLADLEKKYAHNTDATYVLPQVGGRPPVHVIPGAPLQTLLGHYHEMASHKINQARMRGFVFKEKSEYKRLEQFYGTPGTSGAHFTADELHKMSEASASRWVMKNTYQGARSVAGSSLRSVAPFWGASANSNKFYLHTLMEHPELAMPLAQGELEITKKQQSGGLRMNIPFMGAALSKLGMQSGDSFTWEPFNAAFLTREGFGGFIPGMGPVFNYPLEAAPQGVKDFLQTNVPGMQQFGKTSPLLPWVENIASAYSLMTGGNGFEAPLIGRDQGYYKKLVDEKLQQMEADWEQNGRKGPAPTVDQAKRDVGMNRAITGVTGAALPVGLAAGDERRNAILDAEKVWDPGLSAADKKTFFAQNASVADYFKYIDPSTPEQPVDGKESKQDILKRSPWVLSYGTGTSASNIPGRSTIADTQKQYAMDLREGNIRVLDPTEYLTKMRKQEETTQAWNQFDRLQAAYQEYLQTSGVSTNSKEASAWRKANYDQPLNALAREYPDWGSTFVKQTSRTQTGLEFASAPFSSVSTFEVLPQNPALETKATVLWRAALIRRDQAVSALNQVISAKGSQYEKDLVLQGLAQQLDQLATQDPTFKAQLAKYRYSSINDLITFQANQQLLTTEGFPTNG